MSYDGGLSVKVANNELLKILKDHLKRGTFEGSEAIPECIGVKYNRMTLAVDYEYWDCAYVDVCPRHLSQVLDAVIALFDEYSDDISDLSAYRAFKSELKNNASKIDGSYQYVEWIYAHDDGTEETFRYENGVVSYEEA